MSMCMTAPYQAGNVIKDLGASHHCLFETFLHTSSIVDIQFINCGPHRLFDDPLLGSRP